MPVHKEDSSQVTIFLPGTKEAQATLPGILQSASRDTAAADSLFINPTAVQVTATYDVGARQRGVGAPERLTPDPRELVALEAEDGTTLFIRADKLHEELQRLYPEAAAGERLSLDVLAGGEAASRGMGEWFWSRVSLISMGPDAIIEAAEEKAREWLRERLQAKIAQKAEEAGLLSASWLGAKALMWAIESRLAGEPGLYHWRSGELANSDRRPADDTRLVADAQRGILVFIHGTASHTMASFKDLGADDSIAGWKSLESHFQGRIYGFEHRTFSESPIDNALMLARTLPAGARLSLVSHSRGGLVADLLCIGELSEDLIRAYRRDPLPDQTETSWEQAIRERVAAEEQAKLRTLVDLLREKNFQIERYVRVACPAGGTRLLSDNLDVFLSGLLSLMNTAIGALAGPGAAPVLSAFKRIVLEIAAKRMAPHLVPGIEAMLADAPLGRLLAQAGRQPDIRMGVIAGDIEGGGLLKRIGVLFTDWMFFDREDNDLVVDTASMYAGVASSPGTQYIFEQGDKVNHFNYFQNRRSRQCLHVWLKSDSAQWPRLDGWTPLEALEEPSRKRMAQARSAHRAGRGMPQPDTRPVVIFLPGIMGSHLEVRSAGQPGDGDRVWFDFADIARGGFGKIRLGLPNIQPECHFAMFYGDLADYLENTHRVVRFAYDWRTPVEVSADLLAAEVEAALAENPNQPVRLLAHSMGGIVVRAMIARHNALWDAISARDGGRFVMLGTPNNGSHLMVATLLGKTGAIRKLAVIDMKRNLQGLLDIVAGFPGALQLLPRPGFQDSGGARAEDYFAPQVWRELRARIKDRWFGNRVAGVPTGEVLENARKLWENHLLERTRGQDGWRHRAIQPVERLAYVYGQAENTPCGIQIVDNRLMLMGTSEGDGSVTWQSGQLDFLPEERCWYMPVDHGSLAKTAQYFPAVLDLLENGHTVRLNRRPVSRGAGTTRTYDAGPVSYPTPVDLQHSLMGARPVHLKSVAPRQTLRIRVRAMDLRYSQMALMCGHYIGDPIAGAEEQIDKYIVDGKLRHRERLGVYADKIGTAAVVFDQTRPQDGDEAFGKGAIIVGLGEWGQLSAGDLTETVRAGVLRFLLLAQDRIRGADGSPPEDRRQIKLGSVLLGYNSTVDISVDDSVAAVVLGVCEANRQFEDAVGPVLRIGELEFVELFLDTAISAAYAVRDLDMRLERDLKRLETRIDPAPTLLQGAGCRTRLQVSSAFGYWPRMIITDADRPAPACPPECYRIRRISPVPPEMRPQLIEDLTAGGEVRATAEEVKAAPDKGRSSPAVAGSIKFVFLSERARAEAIIAQGQPGLVEKLIRQAIRSDRYRPELSRTLYQLLVPLDFKEAARNASQMVLVLDEYTANLPWEMLCAGTEPMVVKTAVVRQLESGRFRRRVQSTRGKTAFIIADPSTEGFERHFPTPSSRPLPSLPGAAEEGAQVRRILTDAGYEVVYAPAGQEALDVFNKLFLRPYRILVVAAHGVFRAAAGDGRERTGVVLSDGMLLTAAEVGQMEIVPEVVFLNCCHLGQVDSAPTYNRLAYSLARELIDMGVRCVVAAGWAVNDRAATAFAGTFFEGLVTRGQNFGRAIHAARKQTYHDYPAYNTWGAYQAYGDPGFVLEPKRTGSESVRPEVVAPEELTEGLLRIRNNVKVEAAPSMEKTVAEVDALLSRGLKDWRDLPAVQAAIGAVYAEFGPAAFDRARTAYLLAIAGDDSAGKVPVRTIEQLANLEARVAEEMEDPLKGVALADQALARLENLLKAAAATPGAPIESGGDRGPAAVARPNPERWALLGSALKRKATLQARLKDVRAEDLQATIKAARNAYAVAEGTFDEVGFSPYNMLNRIQFDAILGERGRDDGIALAARCQSVARENFSRSYDFFDAVMEIDAEVTIRMMRNSLGDTWKEIATRYQEAFKKVPGSARERDSVAKQPRLMGDFLEVLAALAPTPAIRESMLANARSLKSIAGALTPKASSAPVASGAAVHDRAVQGRKGQGRAKKAAPKRKPKPKPKPKPKRKPPKEGKRPKK